jgi:hypothetical protein
LIIRDYVACETCGHPHTVRIGVGSEKHQPYNFPCNECGENIAIALEIGKGLILKDNAIKGDTEGTAVNLDSFLLPNPAHLGVNHVAQRVKQAQNFFMAQKKHYEKNMVWEVLKSHFFLNHKHSKFLWPRNGKS